jgi:hypothetical protein
MVFLSNSIVDQENRKNELGKQEKRKLSLESQETMKISFCFLASWLPGFLIYVFGFSVINAK